MQKVDTPNIKDMGKVGHITHDLFISAVVGPQRSTARRFEQMIEQPKH